MEVLFRGVDVSASLTGHHARVAVTAGTDDEGVLAAAAALARKLSLPLVGTRDAGSSRFDLKLVVTPDRLELVEAGSAASGAVYVDLLRGPTGYRRRLMRQRSEPLARAVAAGRASCFVVDATAGLARDAFVLALVGCTVLAVERSAVLGALVTDGLKRARASGDAGLIEVLDRLELVVCDARDVLAGMSGPPAPDVVYLDPMYPPRRKSALVKKEMRICRRLVGDDPDAASLLEVARRVTRRRVVVKRQRHASPLAPHPAFQYPGRQVRFDIYLPADR